jgi:hypothetical protein
LIVFVDVNLEMLLSMCQLKDTFKIGKLLMEFQVTSVVGQFDILSHLIYSA